LFRDEAELDRLAVLKLDAPALFAAEKAVLKNRGVSLRDLDRVVGVRVAALRVRGPQDDGQTESPYVVREGVTYRVAQTSSGPVEIPLANFAATITAETIRDDGADARRYFTISGRTADECELPVIDVLAEQFSNMGWITGEWGNRAIVCAGIGVRDHLRTAIQLNSRNVATRTVFGHTGWRKIEGVWVYLHAAGGISSAKQPINVQVSLDGPLAGFEFPMPPIGSELVKSIRSILDLFSIARLAPDRLLVPVFGSVFRAALGGVIDFGVHLLGRTGTFKSEIAAIAQQCFGPKLDARNFPANWSSTANAIEGMVFLAKDAVIVVDDFNPTGAIDPQKLHAAADRLFRGLGNGAGRQRMTADLMIRPHRPPRGLILSTGEDIPRGHSCRARLILVEVRPGDVNPQRLTYAQREAANGVYAAALAGYVHWLAGRYDNIRRGLGNERASARDRFAIDSSHARTPAAIGDLFLGWEYFGRYAVESGAIRLDDWTKLLGKVRMTLVELAQAQSNHLCTADPVDRFLRLIPAVLSAGEAHIESRSGGPPLPAELLGWVQEDQQWRPRGNRIGWSDDHHLYLDPELAYAAVQRLASTQREPITMSADTLRSRLHDRGLLDSVDQRGGSTRYTIRISVSGQRVSVMKFRREVFFPHGASGPCGPDQQDMLGHMGHMDNGKSYRDEKNDNNESALGLPCSR
jgi:hypothetical protein